ncbi:MAG: hypothetical protein EZS28_001541 [Streblomastix strix]|uniref:TmcB/TmcC TPR repeats domain-containing protein n=1 Tax=Streblomastix strix TaxID=222440 RepID=A0A5J4X7V5_9EUKA|nr:MAG: hypothetical protein EZS28_001541 [Streblomastix strix]
MTFQWYFLPLKRSDVSFTGFNYVLKVIGLYFDPSFYLQSHISFIVIYAIVTSLIVLTIAHHFSAFLLFIKETKIPDELQSIVKLLCIIVIHAISTPMLSILAKPILCLLSKNKDDLNPSLNLSHCNYKPSSIIYTIIGLIFIIILLIYGSLFTFFIFHTDLEKPQVNDQRKGIFSSFCFLITGMTVVLQTFIVEISPIASSIIQIIVFIGLGIYVILDQPYIMTFGNQVHSELLLIASSGGITSICLSGLNKLAYLGHLNIEKGIKLVGWLQVIGANMILYLSMFGFVILFGWIVIVKSISKQGLLSPILQSEPKQQPKVNQPKIQSKVSTPRNQSKNSTPRNSAIKESQPVLYNRLPSGVVRISHPNIQWSLSPLLATPSVVHSVFKDFKTPSELEKGMRYMQLEEISVNARIRSFTLAVLLKALKDNEFEYSAEMNVTAALFMQKFKPSRDKVISLLRRATQMFPGWTNRWIIFRMMRDIEEEDMNQQNQVKVGFGALSISSQVENAHSMQVRLQFGQTNYELAKAYLLQTVQLIMRRNVDVDRIMFNFERAADKTLKALEAYFKLLDDHPNNPSILRHVSVLVKDLYNDTQASECLFSEADRIEEQVLALSERIRRNKLTFDKQKDQSPRNQESYRNQDEQKTLQNDFLASLVRKKFKGNGGMVEQYLQQYKDASNRDPKSTMNVSTIDDKQLTDKSMQIIVSLLYLSLFVFMALIIFAYIFTINRFSDSINQTHGGIRAIQIAESICQALDVLTYHMFYVLLIDNDV